MLRFFFAIMSGMLTDEDVAKIKRDLESGVRGPVLLKYLRQLLEEWDRWRRGGPPGDAWLPEPKRGFTQGSASQAGEQRGSATPAPPRAPNRRGGPPP
jgi:hypothetical protein